MPIEIGVWRIEKPNGSGPTHESLVKVASSSFGNELRLEALLADQLDILGTPLLMIGRQVITPSGKRADILAVDPVGELYVIELKRDRTPREAVAQLLDYGSWASSLTYDDLMTIYTAQHEGQTFEQAFAERFGVETAPEALNSAHHLLLVASELDPASERIIDYLVDFGVPVNAVFFRYFKDGETEYLARSWLVHPEQAEVKAQPGPKEPWTGDYYVSFGEGPERNWEDARRYGFISAGGGTWYSKTLSMLSPGSRVLVHIPGVGFVGVGEVTGDRVKAADLDVEVEGAQVPLPQAPGLKAAALPGMTSEDDDEIAEYAVPVKWLKTVPREQAYWKNGFFANQNSVCKLRNRFTRDSVLEHFGITA